MVSVVARVITATVLYVGILFSISLFLAGHNSPGGGFIAGAMTASAFALLYLVFGREYVETRFRVRFRSIAALGLAIAVFFLVLPLAFGLPLLSSLIWTIQLPLLGEIKLVSAVGFDLGIYLAVVGAILTIVRRSATGGEPPG
ncbi:MAG: MnhB domain-containing protein [Thermoplasmata archaeon]|nr:MnhB domain-containing protein [Thermoplasmata archaeon]